MLVQLRSATVALLSYIGPSSAAPIQPPFLVLTQPSRRVAVAMIRISGEAK